MRDPEPSTYTPPPHRIAAIGDAWETVVERITTEADGPDTVNERLSDGGPGPDGQEQTVTERLSGQPDDEDKGAADEKKPAKPAAKRAARSR